MSSILPAPSNTRLITIVAHVDHGKTSLADSLCEHNGIISERIAGTVRYLDSMEEEQRRGITIRSSAIGLKHTYKSVKKAKGPAASNNDNGDKQMVVHLIDSPGHVDFSMEVSSALQICDGAILLVDVVEGICARTQSILREAYSQRLVPVLVLNKIDRLCTDLGLTVNESYARIQRVIENVNAAASNMIFSDRAQALENESSNRNGKISDVTNDEMEMIWDFNPVKGNVIFTTALFGWGFSVPSLARSLFRSKVIPNIKPPLLRQYLFGDFKYRNSDGKVLKWKQNDESNTMFSEYGLKPLWDIMTGVSMAQTSVLFGGNTNHANKDSDSKKKQDVKIKATTPGMVDCVMDALQVGCTTSSDAPSSLQVPKEIDEMQQILKKSNASSEETILRALLRRHRPLSDAVLDAVCEVCPSPEDASKKFRSGVINLLPCSDESIGDEEVKKEFHQIKDAVQQCRSSPDTSAITVAHCCKFISTDRAHISDPDLISYLDNEEAHSTESKGKAGIILGVARVLCGTLSSKDVEYHCFGPKHTSFLGDVPKRTIRLYLLMGSSFIRVNKVPAGHICAIYGLEDLQLKTLTLSNFRNCMPLNFYNRGIRPLVKVNVEAMSNEDTSALEKGLAKLSLADAAVEVTATAKGERILACLGEIHLEQSIIDLKKNYVGEDVELRISKPIVDFRETTAWFENEVDDFHNFYKLDNKKLRQTLIPPYCEEDGLSNAKNGRNRIVVSGRGMAVHVRVLPLSSLVHSCLKNNEYDKKCEDDLKLLSKGLNMIKYESSREIFEKLQALMTSIDTNGNAIMESESMQNGVCVKGVVKRPKEPKEVYVEQNIIDAGDEEKKSEEAMEEATPKKSNIAKEDYEELKIRISKSYDGENESSLKDSKAYKIWKTEFKGSLIGGWQAACASGPICEEPLRNTMVILEGVELALWERRKKTDTEEDFGLANPITGGMVVASLCSAIRTAFLTRPIRIMEGHLKLTLHTSLNGLGPLYEVLTKRRGKVLDDTMVEGTDLIAIEAVIPQSESFGLTSELMKKSSGEVTAPELVFSHWEVLDEDPFWIPTSLEEREDYGEINTLGDISTGLANNALKFIRLVRKRKGLLDDSQKIVVAAEKQRTLARKK